MKSLKELLNILNEHVPNDRVPHVHSPGYSPPNILILKRKTVRSYSSTERVALYYNEKLDRYFSVPYTVGSDSDRDDVVGVSEETSQEASAKRSEQVSKTWANRRKRWNDWKEKQKKPVQVKEDVIEGVLTEDAISHLKKVKEFGTDKPLYHKDGSQTRVDPTTAHALLTVHGALHPDNQKKFSDALEHSKAKFHKVLDFAWKQVK